jgi:hypothetical protein
MSDEKKPLFTREDTWRTYDGTVKPIKDLEDSHILNLIAYTAYKLEGYVSYLEELDPENDPEDMYGIQYEMRQRRVSKYTAIHQVIQEEVDLRNLDRSLVSEGKRLPFKKDGKWMIWKKGDKAPTEVPQSIDFIKPLGDEIQCRK